MYNVPELDFIIKNKIPIGSNKNGIYFLFYDNQIVYVGQTIRGKNRVFEHCENKIFDSFYFFEIPESSDLKEKLSEIETSLILKYSPKYNSTLSTSLFKTLDGLKKYTCLTKPFLKKIITENNVEPFIINAVLYYKITDVVPLIPEEILNEARRIRKIQDTANEITYSFERWTDITKEYEPSILNNHIFSFLNEGGDEMKLRHFNSKEKTAKDLKELLLKTNKKGE